MRNALQITRPIRWHRGRSTGLPLPFLRLRGRWIAISLGHARRLIETGLARTVAA